MNKRKPFVIMVTVYDNSNVGGPMWAARDEFLDAYLCKDWETAFDTAVKYIKRHYPKWVKEVVNGDDYHKPFEKYSFADKKKRLADLGSIGFQFERKTVR